MSLHYLKPINCITQLLRKEQHPNIYYTVGSILTSLYLSRPTFCTLNLYIHHLTVLSKPFFSVYCRFGNAGPSTGTLTSPPFIWLSQSHPLCLILNINSPLGTYLDSSEYLIPDAFKCLIPDFSVELFLIH